MPNQLYNQMNQQQNPNDPLVMIQQMKAQGMQPMQIAQQLFSMGMNPTQIMQQMMNRGIIDQNRNTQTIMDKLCQLELDGVKNQLAQAQRENVGLQNQLNLAVTRNDLNQEVDALYNRLKNCPVGTVPVYGSQPIFSCPGNGFNGCGCSGNTFMN